MDICSPSKIHADSVSRERESNGIRNFLWCVPSASKAPSTRIRIFFNQQFFLSGYKNSPSTPIAFARPHASADIWIHSRETKPTCCAAILVYCSVRDWTRFVYVVAFENIRIHRPHIIGFVVDLFFFHSGERIQNLSDSDPDTCGRGLNVVRIFQ